LVAKWIVLLLNAGEVAGEVADGSIGDIAGEACKKYDEHFQAHSVMNDMAVMNTYTSDS
jgi:hypothetical protein